MLNHLKQQRLALTAREKKVKMEDVNLLWDRGDDIETYFVQANKLEEDLEENYGIEWTTRMKIKQAEDEIYWSKMFSKEELMAWEENPGPTRRGSTLEPTSRTDGPRQCAIKAILTTSIVLRALPAQKNTEAIRQDT